MNTFPLLSAILALALSGCPENTVTDARTDALDPVTWDCSVWISAADAPVVTGKVNSRTNRRAADPAEPGFKHILMQPVPDKRLGSIDAIYHSAAGTIRSAWKYEGDVCHWTFTIPEGCSAAVTLPGENETRTYGPGTHKLSF